MGASKKADRLVQVFQNVNKMKYLYPVHTHCFSRKSMKTLQAAVESQKNKMTAISFIETHFNRKECVKFIPVSANSSVCHCGEEKHINKENNNTLDAMETIVEELDVNNFQQQKPVLWHPATAIQV